MKTKENSNLRKTLNKETVIDLYINQNKPLKEVADILNVSVSTLNRFKNDNNIKKPFRYFSNDEDIQIVKQQIINLQNQGIAKTNICKTLHINSDTYNKIMGLEKKEVKNIIDDAFIDISNPDFCYFLGVFIADGHIDDIRVYISQCDITYLNKLKTIMRHKGVAHKATNTPNPCYRLDIYNKKLKQFLQQYNISSNKKLNAPYIDCGDNDSHFMRGLFDGDGCLYYSYISGKLKQRRVSITTGSEYVKNGIIQFLNKHNIPYTITTTTKLNICYNIFIDAIEDIIRFLDLLYKEKNNSFLDRKYISFLKFKNLINMNKQVNDIVDGITEM